MTGQIWQLHGYLRFRGGPVDHAGIKDLIAQGIQLNKLPQGTIGAVIKDNSEYLTGLRFPTSIPISKLEQALDWLTMQGITLVY